MNPSRDSRAGTAYPGAPPGRQRLDGAGQELFELGGAGGDRNDESGARPFADRVVLADEHVGHRFTIEQGLIQAMEVCPLPSSDHLA